jgi:hypothetical protein
VNRKKRPSKTFEVLGKRAEDLLEGDIDEITEAVVEGATEQADERPVVAAWAPPVMSAKAADSLQKDSTSTCLPGVTMFLR